MKERKGIFKKLVIGGVAGLTTFLTLVFGGCDTLPQKPENPQNPNPPYEQQSTTVGEILSEVAAGVEQKVQNKWQSAVDDVKENFEQQKHVTISNEKLVLDGNRLVLEFDYSGTKSGIGSSVVQVPNAATTLIDMTEDELLDAILDEAEMLEDSVVLESEEATVRSSLTTALQTLLDQITTSSVVQNNTYVSGRVFKSGNELNKVNRNAQSVTYGPVREDGSFVIIERGDNIVEHLVKMENADGFSDESVWSMFVTGMKGVDYTMTSRTLNPANAYTEPPVEQKPEIVTVTFDELYDEVFGNYQMESFEDIIQYLAETKSYGTNIHAIFSGIDNNNQFCIYSDQIDTLNYNVLGKLTYKNSDISIFNNYKSKCNKGVKNYIYGEFAKEYAATIEEPQKQAALQFLQSLKSQLEEEASTIKNLNKSDFKATIVQSNAKTLTETENFGQKYLADKPNAQLIKAYVGSMSNREIDGNRLFNTGYTSAFNLCVVYKENNEIKIYKSMCMIPWYTDSTTESLYNSFLNGTRDTAYKLGAESTTTVSDVVMVEEPATSASEDEKVFYMIDLPIIEEERERKLG